MGCLSIHVEWLGLVAASSCVQCHSGQFLSSPHFWGQGRIWCVCGWHCFAAEQQLLISYLLKNQISLGLQPAHQQPSQKALTKCCPKPAVKRSHGAQSGGCHLLSLWMVRNECVTPQPLSALFGRGDCFSLSLFFALRYPFANRPQHCLFSFLPLGLGGGLGFDPRSLHNREGSICAGLTDAAFTSTVCLDTVDTKRESWKQKESTMWNLFYVFKHLLIFLQKTYLADEADCRSSQFVMRSNGTGMI